MNKFLNCHNNYIFTATESKKICQFQWATIQILFLCPYDFDFLILERWHKSTRCSLFLQGWINFGWIKIDGVSNDFDGTL